jgi:RND family efflux transporter MFP subunit
MSRSILKIVLPILVLLLGAGATAALVRSRKAPERVERPVLGPLVEVVTVQAADVRLEVAGQGEVSPRVRVELAPQVTGRVVEVHPALVSGGRFRRGTTLVTIDPRDYELGVERSRAAVASAQTLLERELAEADAAREEWTEVHGDKEPPALLVRGPQVREARARIAAAEADLAGAELQLERTRLTLPFDGLVIDESVDPGQLVASGQRIATVFGTDAVEIRVPLDDSELEWLDLVSGGRGGPPASVVADFAGARHTWPARVDRLEGQVDARSRMVHVVVLVKDPFAALEGRPPLLPGTFVEVKIEGSQLEAVVAVPRHALREGEKIWVVKEGVLSVREVEVIRSERLRVLIGEGLESGETVVTSSLDAVTDGMAVRTWSGDAGADHE